MSRLFSLAAVALVAASAFPQDQEKPWESQKRKIQDEMGAVPPEILAKQSSKKTAVPSVEDAVPLALQAAKDAAAPLVDPKSHEKGKVLKAPGDHATIQAAIDAAQHGDTVRVAAGTYFEQVVLKDGVKLESDAADGGDELVEVEGARLKLPKRALRTILDGSKAEASPRGMIDFAPGAGRGTVVDGFTIQNLPKQDHHKPGHAHAVNVRGASPIVMNCWVRRNGSTGIGNHVIYGDQDKPMAERDLRWANIKHRATAVIYNNVVSENFGLGVGCNHFSDPFILGNEVFGNDDSALGEASSAIGCKHGAAPVVVGNIVHDNAGGGILGKVGEKQGAHDIDRPTHPTIKSNVVYANGKEWPAIGSAGGGSADLPVQIVGNFAYPAGPVGIALRDGAVGVIEDNKVSGGKDTGISVNGSTALKLNRNQATGSEGVGIAIVNRAAVTEMLDNAADGNSGPRFVLRDSTIEGKGPPEK